MGTIQELDIHFDGTDALCEKWGDVKNDAFKKEPKEVVQLLNEYDVISKLKNDDEKINYYEEKYTELNQIINRKYDQITFIRNSSLDIQMHTNSKKIELLIYQKQESLNKLIDCLNRIIDRMIEVKEMRLKNIIKEYNARKKPKLYNELQSSKQPKVKSVKYARKVVENNLDLLKNWSRMERYRIVFDSFEDGSGGKDSLRLKVFNKSNLYFVTADDKGNVFGIYINGRINKVDDIIKDDNAFLFSLSQKNGSPPSKYPLRRPYYEDGFLLSSSGKSKNGLLYSFGKDLCIYEVKSSHSSCEKHNFDYGRHDSLFSDIGPKFSVIRLIVVQMS